MADQLRKEGWFRKDLLQAIVITIVMVAIFEPAIKLVWSWLLILSGAGYSGMLNRFYRNASLGDRNWIDVFLISAVVLFMFIDMLKPHLQSLAGKLTRGGTQLSPKANIRRDRLDLFLLLVFSVAAFLFLAGVYIDLQLNASFQQRVTVLAPAISDQEYEELQALWASMETRGDYLALSKRMESMALSKGVELPKPLLR